ncbi:MAG TPA: slipin family protein [Terracidiphilus sp.]
MSDGSLALWIFIAIIILYLLNSIKILREYERAVIFRLGRALPAPKGPGIILVFRPLDQMVRISLRQEVLEVPPQDVITKDNVTIKVNAVVTLYVVNPNDVAIKVVNYVYQTSQFAQTTLRSVLGEVELDEVLSHRDKLNLRIQTIIDQRTEPFGVKVISVEIKQVDLSEQLLRAMARQAEAERDKRSKVIHADGEYIAAQKLVDAATLMSTQPMTLQLRYLQTLADIGVEKNTTIVFPLPLEMLTMLNKMSGLKPAPPEKL